MNAISIGPFVFDGGRFAAVVSLLLFFLVAEITARFQRRDLPGDAGRWTGLAVIVWLLAARAGFVITNWSQFAAHPQDIVKLWQGGFLPSAGWAGGGAVLLWAMLREARAALKPMIIGAVAALITHQAMTAMMPRPDVTLPTMQLIAMDGSAVQLAGRDRPVVLNLWATWCQPCRREMPMMTELAGEIPDVDFIFANQGEEASQINRFLQNENLPDAGMLRDPQSRLMSALKAIGLPSTLVFDANGTLVVAQTGEVSRAGLLQMIEKATKGGL